MFLTVSCCCMIDSQFRLLTTSFCIIMFVDIKCKSSDREEALLLTWLNVSESDTLGPIDYFSDIKNLVSFERVCLKITVSNTE